jgi:hypothetical protein
MKYRTSLEDMTESRDSWKEMAQNLMLREIEARTLKIPVAKHTDRKTK